jgi:hypothetical protein
MKILQIQQKIEHSVIDLLQTALESLEEEREIASTPQTLNTLNSIEDEDI